MVYSGSCEFKKALFLLIENSPVFPHPYQKYLSGFPPRILNFSKVVAPFYWTFERRHSLPLIINLHDVLYKILKRM